MKTALVHPTPDTGKTVPCSDNALVHVELVIACNLMIRKIRGQNCTFWGTIACPWSSTLKRTSLLGVDRLSAPILSICTIIDIGHFHNRFAGIFFFLCKQTYYLQVTLFIGE